MNNTRIIKNYTILDTYDHLISKKVPAKLAVYRGRTIILIQQPHSFLQRITQIFKNVYFGILRKVGLLKDDQKSIDALKNEALTFMHEKEISTIKNLENKIENLTKENSIYFSHIQSLTAEVENLSKKIDFFVEKIKVTDQITDRVLSQLQN